MTSNDPLEVPLPPPVQQRLRQSRKRAVFVIVMALPFYFVIGTWISLRNYALEGQLGDAVNKGDIRLVLETLDKLPRSERYSNQALRIAANKGRRDVLEAVLPRTDREGRTRALRWAVQGNHSELIASLTAAGADLNSRDREGNTFLTIAVSAGDRGNVAELLAAGADPLLKDRDGKTARDLALASKEREIVRLIDAALRARPESRLPAPR